MSTKKTASETAADYAAKKKAQMERAAKLKEERKRNGGSTYSNSYDEPEPDPEPIVQAPPKTNNRPSSAIPKLSNNSNNSGNNNNTNGMPSEYPVPTKSASSSNSNSSSNSSQSQPQPQPKSIHGPLIKKTGLPFDLNGPTNPSSLTLLKQKHGIQSSLPSPSPSPTTKQNSIPPPSRGTTTTTASSKPPTHKKTVQQQQVKKPEPEEEEPQYTQYDDPSDSTPIPTLSGESSNNNPDPYSSTNVNLVECPNCSRKFASDRLAKHAKVCKKVFVDKRKVFDSRTARVEGTEAAAFVASAKKKEVADARKAVKTNPNGSNGVHSNNNQQNSIASMPKWKIEREQFRAAMKAARGDKGSNDNDSSSSAPSEPYIDPSLVQCPSCGRRFNPISADKHIQICQNQRSKPQRLQKGGGMSAAKAKTIAPNSPAPSSLHPKKPMGSTMGMGNTTHQGSPTLSTLNNNGGLVPCPYCNRKFEFHAYQRHSEICAKVQNKPKGVRR